MIWAPTDKEGSRITPRILTVGAGIKGTPSVAISWHPKPQSYSCVGINSPGHAVVWTAHRCSSCRHRSHARNKSIDNPIHLTCFQNFIPGAVLSVCGLLLCCLLGLRGFGKQRSVPIPCFLLRSSMWDLQWESLRGFPTINTVWQGRGQGTFHFTAP